MSDTNLILGLVALAAGLFVLVIYYSCGKAYWRTRYEARAAVERHDAVMGETKRRTPDTEIVPASALRRAGAEAEVDGW